MTLKLPPGTSATIRTKMNTATQRWECTVAFQSNGKLLPSEHDQAHADLREHVLRLMIKPDLDPSLIDITIIDEVHKDCLDRPVSKPDDERTSQDA
jgi:hypothetical protein